MFKYLLLKTIYDMSDGSVVERSRYDMSFKYFLDMTPEEDVINPSSLCKFRKLRLKDTDLLSLLIGKTVSIAVEKGIIKSNSIIVDATHTASRSNPMSAVDMLRLRAKQLRKTVYGHDEELKDIMPKKNDENDIDKELAYTEKLLKTLKENPVLCEIPKIKERIEILFDVEKCRRCPLREGCYRPGAKSKTYSISVKTPEQNAHLKFEKSERFREKMKERYKIEAKNAELKNVYGYGRAESYGIDCMRLQGAMAIFASNLKRIIKIYK